MNYDPQKHHRCSIRLQNYDYTKAGAYFVTVCTGQRQCLLGGITGGAMSLNEIGKMVQWHWQQIPRHFHHVEIG